MVDSGEVALSPAVEISYFSDDKQYMILAEMEGEVCTPSHAQTIRVRRLHAEDKLTEEAIMAIMEKRKA